MGDEVGATRSRPHRARKPRPPPPKLLGEVDEGQGSRCFDGAGAGWWAAPLPDPPPQTARGRENGSRAVVARSKFIPSPACGRGWRGDEPGEGPAGAVRCQLLRDRILPSPRGTSGEGPGEGPPSGAVGCPSQRDRILPSPRGTRGEGPGVGDRVGRSPMLVAAPPGRGDGSRRGGEKVLRSARRGGEAEGSARRLPQDDWMG